MRSVLLDDLISAFLGDALLGLSAPWVRSVTYIHGPGVVGGGAGIRRPCACMCVHTCVCMSPLERPHVWPLQTTCKPMMVCWRKLVWFIFPSMTHKQECLKNHRKCLLNRIYKKHVQLSFFPLVQFRDEFIGKNEEIQDFLQKKPHPPTPLFCFVFFWLLFILYWLR